MANCSQCGRKLPPFSMRKICEWCVRHEAAQRGEEPEDAIQPVMPTPWAGAGTSPMMVTQALFGLNIAVFILMAFSGNAMDFSPQQLVASGANYGPLTLGREPWRLVTAMFLHGGVWHILFNMWCLWDLGALCEGLYGHSTFAAVYLISGIGGSLASVWWHPTTSSVGASGAIFGIVGALIASYYLGEFSVPRYAVTSRLRSVLIFVGYNLVLGAMWGRTDNAAHIGGLVTGLAVGALIAVVAPEHEPFRRIAVIGTVSLILLGCGARLYQTRSYLMHATRADQLLDDNRTGDAIVELQASIKQRPDYVPAHFALAHAYSNEKKYDLAEAELKRVLALQPRDSSAQYELGFVYINQKRFSDAKSIFQQLVNTDQNDGYAHLGFAMALAGEENHAAAVGEYKLAAQLESDLETVYYRMGLSDAKLRDYDQAITDFLKQQELRGDDADTESALADAYRAKGMTAQADEALKKAEKLKSIQ